VGTGSRGLHHRDTPGRHLHTAEEANEICNEANRNAIEDFMVPAPSQSQIEPTWPQTGDRQRAIEVGAAHWITFASRSNNCIRQHGTHLYMRRYQQGL
jgi:hypothetical protein